MGDMSRCKHDHFQGYCPLCNPIESELRDELAALRAQLEAAEKDAGDVQQQTIDLCIQVIETTPLEIPAGKYSQHDITLMQIAEAGCRGAFIDKLRGLK